MSLFATQLLINKLQLPKDILEIVKDFAFRRIRKIPSDDSRYANLLNIPEKEYDPKDKSTFVYIGINDDKDYFLVYKDFKIYLQVFRYDHFSNRVHFVDGSIFEIKDNEETSTNDSYT
jgi:hypothetical protein